MKKKLFIIAGILLIFGIIVWFFLREDAAPTVDTSPLPGSPFGSGAGVSVPATPAIDPTFEGEIPAVEETIEGVKLYRIANTPVAGFMVMPQSAAQDRGATSTSPLIIRYVDRATGHIIESTLEEKGQLRERKISNTTLPKLYEAHFRSDGNAVLVRSLRNDSDTIDNISLILTPPRATSTDGLYSVSAVQLRGRMDSVAAGSGDTLFYTLRDSESINSSDFAGGKVKTILNSPFTHWRLGRAGDNLLAYTKASASVPGYAYILNAATGGLSKILGPLPGLTASANTAGNRVIYSYLNGSTVGLFAKNLQSEKEIEILPSTFAEKCAWSAREASVFVCGTPPTGITGNEPDNWYQGKTHFSDDVWRFNSDTEISEIVADLYGEFGAAIDVYEPRLSSDGQYFIFINRNDLTLWALKMR